MKRPGWGESFLVGTVATVVALRLQTLLRDLWQIRGLPERVMEWLLLFVPLDLFERALQRFGGSAKDLGLFCTILGMGALLLLIGMFALRAGWSSWRLLGLGWVLWLLTMVVVMPVTGAGLFAKNLMLAPVLVDAAFLFMFLAYASVLIGGRLLLRRVRSSAARRQRTTRPAHCCPRERRRTAAGTLRRARRRRGHQQSAAGVPPTPRASVAPAAARGSHPRSRCPGDRAATPMPAARPDRARRAARPRPHPALPNRRPTARWCATRTARSPPPVAPHGTLAPPITANHDFYVVTKNAVADPIVDAASWRLVVDGEVNNPVQFDYRTLRTLPSVEVTKTLECISNFTAHCDLASFGCDLISTARWRGARLGDVLDLAGGLKPGVVALAFALDRRVLGRSDRPKSPTTPRR